MELDEFKNYWKTIQDKEFTQQELTNEKLDQIIMKTTDTLDYLQKTSAYWIRTNNTNVQKLKGLLIPFLLVIILKAFLMADKTETIEAFAINIGTSLIYMAIILIHYFTTVWIFKRQQEIFTLNNTKNLKETVAKIIDDFTKYYVKFNIIYMFLYPAYFYSIIKFITFWTPSTNILLLTCALLTIFTLAIGHLLHILKYSDKIKSLKTNLKELKEDF
ncbi:hypothetical protein ADIARSV_2116 [Arcticibacter svalbardensis MN12-7]|uniref:Uncharacterized protein n=1 Tax=Arcticibacter svalbardensis MN12-7 TaxID=1150600 RepID=R9GSC2_9SPHI|nr:hypothetical protein [Arcticibacter svalbardensis]EOR94742.1 hypothetical protein ADIARSV_2116 [Arcticibacter svalbardensis MN12-7]